MRHEYEAYQAQAETELSQMTEQMAEVRKEQQRQEETIRRLNAELLAAGKDSDKLAEANTKCDMLQSELADARRQLEEERQSKDQLHQQVQHYRTAAQ